MVALYIFFKLSGWGASIEIDLLIIKITHPVCFLFEGNQESRICRQFFTSKNSSVFSPISLQTSDIFNILRHIKNTEAKSSSQMHYTWRFFTRCLPIAFTPTSAFLFMSERENTFSANCSKYAVDCDWNRKNSQNVQILGFFQKNRWAFSKRILNISIFATCGSYF